MLVGVGVGVLDPGDAAHHVGAELDRLPDQLLGTRVAQQPVLRERHHLQVHDAAELLAQRQQRDHALQPRLGVDVREGQHVAHAVPDGLDHRPPGVRLDPGAVVVGLHRGRQLDRRERGGHVAGGVRRQRGVTDPIEGVHLVEVQVAVDEALGHQGTGRVDLLAPTDPVLGDLGDPVAVDADPPAPLAAAQGRVGDDEVVRHAGVTGIPRRPELVDDQVEGAEVEDVLGHVDGPPSSASTTVSAAGMPCSGSSIHDSRSVAREIGESRQTRGQPRPGARGRAPRASSARPSRSCASRSSAAVSSGGTASSTIISRVEASSTSSCGEDRLPGQHLALRAEQLVRPLAAVLDADQQPAYRPGLAAEQPVEAVGEGDRLAGAAPPARDGRARGPACRPPRAGAAPP